MKLYIDKRNDGKMKKKIVFGSDLPDIDPKY